MLQDLPNNIQQQVLRYITTDFELAKNIHDEWAQENMQQPLDASQLNE